MIDIFTGLTICIFEMNWRNKFVKVLYWLSYLDISEVTHHNGHK